MQKPAWSVRLDGDSCHSLFVDRGRIVVSTARREDADTAAGISTITNVSTSAGTGSARTTYVNFFAHRCYGIDPAGAIAWSADGIVAKAACPDGDIVATNDRNDLIVQRGTAKLHERPMSEASWRVLGWHEAKPITTSIAGAVWVEPFIYAVVDNKLQRSDAEGNVLEQTPIAREPFEAIVRERNLTGWPPWFHCPQSLDLAYHPGLDRLIASNWTTFAWTLRLRRNGTIDWVKLLTESCCNHLCLVGDRIAHASSCGESLTFLSPDGEIGRAHALPELTGRMTQDGGLVVVEAAAVLHAFDEHGEPRWKLDVPNLGRLHLHDGTLYTVSGEAGALELTAWA